MLYQIFVSITKSTPQSLCGHVSSLDSFWPKSLAAANNSLLTAFTCTVES